MRTNRRKFLIGAAGGIGAVYAKDPPPYAPDHAITVISGKARERGLQYGGKFRQPIQSFLENEIYGAFAKNPPSKDSLLSYAGQCTKEIQAYSPTVMQELEGIAQGSGVQVEEAVLITLHEELYHRGIIPPVLHCTAVAAGPPDTRDGHTYIAQSWDWYERLYGMSSLLLWRRTEGPSLLTYSYPGLWVGAGMNSAGLALVWTSAENIMKIPGPRVGIPTYVLVAQMLYQDSLEGAVEEARRAKHAGWFAIMLADAKGQITKVEGAPGELAVERARGSLVGVYYCTRQITRTPEGQPVKFHPQAQRMWDLMASKKGEIDRTAIQGFYADHQSTICKHYSTLDNMIFDTTAREAWINRGPGCSGRWKRFTFPV